jgi:ferredoxin-NADP reductase/ferredoxin
VNFVIHEGRRLECRPDETVLEALLRQGVDAPYSCRAGVCHACLCRSENGRGLNPESFRGLSAEQKADGWFLTCQAKPEGDLVLRDAAGYRSARVLSLRQAAPDVFILRLESRDLPYRPGQFLQLRLDGLSRPYSLASHPAESHLEFHIRRLDGGALSPRLCALREGDSVDIGEAAGSCHYASIHAGTDLVLAATGTGLAPLIGILKDAIKKEHGGWIFLFHGGRTAEDLYFDGEIRELMKKHPRLLYRPALTRASQNGIASGRLTELIPPLLKTPAQCSAFLCGHPDFVRELRLKLFLAGLPSARILADAFSHARS